MARKNDYGKKRSSKGQFMRLPYEVIDSLDYLSLQPSSKQLLIDIFRQHNGRNNGDLSASFKLMQARGWTSKGTLKRALDGLLASELIIRTREGWFQGEHSSRCALYAVTWLGVDECPGKDLDVKANPRPLRAFTIENKNSPCPRVRPEPVQKRDRSWERDSCGRYTSASKKVR